MEENFEGVEVAIAGLDAVVQGNHEDTQRMFADMKGWLEDRVCQCAPSLVFLASRACAVRLLLWCRFSLFFFCSPSVQFADQSNMVSGSFVLLLLLMHAFSVTQLSLWVRRSWKESHGCGRTVHQELTSMRSW